MAKKITKSVKLFLSEQYLVLFFILTTSIKLGIFSTYVIKITWYMDQYYNQLILSVICAALIFSPLYFFKKYKNLLAIIIALIISVLLLIDGLYFSYFSSLPTVGIINLAGQSSDIGPAISSLLSWQLLLYFIDVIFVFIFFKKIKTFFSKLQDKHQNTRSKNMAKWAVTLFTILLLAVQMMNIGISHLSDVFNKGYDTISTAQRYGIIGAHIIDLARFINQETTNLSPEQIKEMSSWVTKNKPAPTSNTLTGVAKGKNIIMIQVESLGGFVINQTVNNKQITPNLNELAKNSEFFPNSRFILGAGHTSDVDFVANTSYFPLNDAAVFVRYGQDDFTSLPKTLTTNGYSAYAYHGFNRNFWNRDIAFGSLGYQKFYAADNYPVGQKINMGINDGDFLSETADYIRDQPKPSFSYAITLTSHTPFEITDQTRELNINPSDYPNQVAGYLENINYTDRMLGNFFNKLKQNDLYDDSLIIVYGDHTPVLSSFKTEAFSYDPATNQGKEIPLFIKLPGKTENKIYPNKGTQLDIMPTILDLLGVKTNQLMFGQSLFTDSKNQLEVCDDQLVVFKSDNCKDMLADEKNRSATIIRYNQFNNLPK